MSLTKNRSCSFFPSSSRCVVVVLSKWSYSISMSTRRVWFTAKSSVSEFANGWLLATRREFFEIYMCEVVFVTFASRCCGRCSHVKSVWKNQQFIAFFGLVTNMSSFGEVRVKRVLINTGVEWRAKWSNEWIRSCFVWTMKSFLRCIAKVFCSGLKTNRIKESLVW